MMRTALITRVWCLLALCLGAGPLWAADAVPTAADPAFERRVRSITEELRCLVCQNQTVADSTAPLAVDLQNQVRSQLQAGRSPDEIRQYMTDRYGDFVLYKPPMKASTWLLWLGPLVLLLVGLGVLWRTLAQRSTAPTAQGLNDEERRRAAKLLQDDPQDDPKV
jgi:cytochrome c-type biogenesis protein CcmH/NrfF